MTDPERMILEDAIETAIRAEKTAVRRLRLLCFFAGLSGGLLVSCITLMVKLYG